MKLSLVDSDWVAVGHYLKQIRIPVGHSEYSIQVAQKFNYQLALLAELPIPPSLPNTVPHIQNTSSARLRITIL